MAELLVYVLCGCAGLFAGAALGLGAGWLLGVRLVDRGPADGEPSAPKTTLAAKALMGLGGLLGAPGAILLCLLVKAGGW
jgi:hypothetical protein